MKHSHRVSDMLNHSVKTMAEMRVDSGDQRQWFKKKKKKLRRVLSANLIHKRMHMRSQTKI